eukprot:CAMPEP_0185277274 /NCGR_PEP_ID=MMETSP1359-20130426/58228_1 /TAXON_ID=552665 /ORGANISM="Bigelowiella longifila, Strain CCMP242" /LENGTH=246 /DNA_ID=CAMNT_0027871327 /DNA_START=217 /DNA_END=958 /DNA_ORIENTATION=+
MPYQLHPDDCYVRDLRILFENPEKGLALLNSMYSAAFKVIETQFIGNKKWKQKILKKGETHDAKTLEKHLISGLNFPPSQYWLHLQCMLPPLTPFHYSMYLEGRHFTYGRFFPVEYVKSALELGAPIKNAREMGIQELIRKIEAKGVRYDEYWTAAYARYGMSHRALSNWNAKDFSRVIVNGKTVAQSGDFKVMKENADDILKKDKLALQNYGRPYREDGRPSGNFYKYAKKKVLPVFLSSDSSSK